MRKMDVFEMKTTHGGASVEFYCPKCDKNCVFSAWLSIFAYAQLALHQGGIGCKKKK